MPKRVLRGVVVSNTGDKTVVVRVERRVLPPRSMGRSFDVARIIMHTTRKTHMTSVTS